MSFVAVDLGASSSRHVSDSGNIMVTPNYMAELPVGTTSKIQPDTADLSSSLEVQIEKISGEACEHFPVNVLIGIMADRYTSLHDRPSVNAKKCLQKINYVSAIVVAAINRLTYELSEDIDLYLAVPPIEIHNAREMFSQKLVGKYNVTFPKYMGGTTVGLNIRSVHCYEESFMASTSFFFNMNGIPKEQNKKYLTGTVLSLDIGASTTDLAVIKNGRYLDKSGQTYRAGGNEARDYLMNAVCERYDAELSVEDAEKCMAEGRLQQGNTYADISDIVSEAKTALAKKLTNHMQTYFKRVGIDINSINAIVVSGGGSMQSQYINDDGEVIKTSEPMSYFVTKELTNWSKGTEVVAYGDDARFANVKGLFIRAKLESVKNSQQAQTVAPTPQAQSNIAVAPTPAATTEQAVAQAPQASTQETVVQA